MFRRTGNFNDAIRQFTRVLVKPKDPKRPDEPDVESLDDKTVYIERGLVYQDMGNHEYAIKDFTTAI